MERSIAYWIRKRANITPNRVALIGENREFTYQDLFSEVNRVSAFLQQKLHLKKGERFAILSQNRVEYLITYFAAAQLGFVAVPLNIRLSASELAYQIQDSGAKAILYESELKSLFDELHQLVSFESAHTFEEGYAVFPMDNIQHDFSEGIPNDPYIICYTSGTTGKPKGAVLTQENMFWNALNNQYALDLTSSDKCLVILPLFHIGGIGLFAFPTFLSGGTVIVPGKFHPKNVLKIIEDLQVTVMMGVPTIFNTLKNEESFHQTDFKSVRVFCSGGAPCPVELIEDYHKKGIPLYQGFGMTETSPTVFMLSKEDFQRKVGSIGKPVMFCEIDLVDDLGKSVKQGEVGELIIKGGNVFKEYWGLPEKTAEAIIDGWFYTGDLAYKDEEGYIYIAGRKKDMIISGGENIYPLEIEQVIGELKEVNEVAVIGIQDEKWGEVPIAIVSLKENESLLEEQVQNYCSRKLAKYKVPKQVVFLDDLPKNATGKLDKKVMQQNYNFIHLASKNVK
ncbi:o-succinylbenzoate--CoA ligase [Ureibacillus acetophenoni]|uniref:2-succinylbenzoate--CoA ligase n=1 Tax=Ureibacillus acetophenoni TaxID=614649 RepID=A0A285UJI6_9BACL|nr:o-succinylbenzoate--CoA ligase [Ureibacillus acetophenoni]SOC41847.1 fatty-acyl-CoA synthase [Ureibacillus acetophenoni]